VLPFANSFHQKKPTARGGVCLGTLKSVPGWYWCKAGIASAHTRLVGSLLRALKPV
jgi:hypothetical protein